MPIKAESRTREPFHIAQGENKKEDGPEKFSSALKADRGALEGHAEKQVEHRAAVLSRTQTAKLGMDPGWWKKAVFYQIYPRSFLDTSANGMGDLAGIISKLDYLNDGNPDSTDALGVDAIWFSPFFPGPDHDYGYDISDYCAIDPRFGTMADFELLVKEARRRGIKLILDLVVNHTSFQHPWFKESRSSRDNPKRDWYIWKDGRGRANKPPNNWRNSFFGSAWSWDEKTEQYYLHSFLREQADLNWYNPQVREAVADVIRFWLDRGVDGFRLDVPHIYCKDRHFRNNPSFLANLGEFLRLPLGDRSLFANLYSFFCLPELQARKYNMHQPETHQVLKEFRQVFDAYPAVTSVGETIGEDPALIASYYGEKGDELHMNFFFELIYCRWKAGAFRRCLDRWEKALPAGAWPAYFLSNHDRPRTASRYGAGVKGERRARILAMLLLTLRGTPFLYYGEEIGMLEAKLTREELRDPFGIRWYPIYPGRDGCRTPMQWDSSPKAGFTKAEPWLPVGPEHEKLNVAGAGKDPRSHLNLVKRLIRLRKQSPAMLEGEYEAITAGIPGNCFAYSRKLIQGHKNSVVPGPDGASDQTDACTATRSTSRQGEEGEELIIVLNFSSRPQKIALKRLKGAERLLLSTDSDRSPEMINGYLQLDPEEGCILEAGAGTGETEQAREE